MVAGDELSEVIPYKRPLRRPEPKLDPPPREDELFQLYTTDEIQKAANFERIYSLARSGVFSPNCHIPPWGAYHAMLSDIREEDRVVSKVAFMPINKSDPTDLSTINTTSWAKPLKLHEQSLVSLRGLYCVMGACTFLCLLWLPLVSCILM